MSHGPTLLFDKSAMQRYSAAEADWLTHFFRGVVAPIYLLEVQGDLAKKPKKGDSASMVASLSAKAHSLGTYHNVLHHDLIEGEILGHPVEMRGVPILGGGEMVTDASGKSGMFFDVAPEDEMLMRWARKQFAPAEHEHAANYRSRAKGNKVLEELIRDTAKRRRKDAVYPSSVEDVLAGVDRFLDDPTSQFRTLTTALSMFDCEKHKTHVYKHWVRYGRPEIRYFLPYTYFCLRVTLTFMHGVGLQLIDQRPTNVIDLQYLYYLPFCQIFLSADTLHRQLAPLFLKADQKFIWGDDMHAGLKILTAHYAGITEDERLTGSANYARFPPLHLSTIVHELYDHMMPGWRRDAAIPYEPITKEENDRVMAELGPIIDAIQRRRKPDGSI